MKKRIREIKAMILGWLMLIGMAAAMGCVPIASIIIHNLLK